MKPSLPTEPALVGRDSEIEQLLQRFDSASKGRETTVFICGEAGVGKTRLVNEFLARAKKMGAEILCGWCLSEAAVPYFPFTKAFNMYMSTTSDAKAKSAVTDQLGITGWLRGTGIAREHKPLGITGWLKGTGLTREPQEFFSTPEIERDKTFEAVARVLVRLSAQRPLVLFVDDLHWADPLSLALIHYLSRKCRDSRLLIVGTYRPEETIPIEERRLHPLEETIFSMSREDLLVKMELKSLKHNDLSELVRSIFHASMDEAFVEKLYKETEGNPLFAIETLNLLVEEGFLSEKEGKWTLTTPMEKMGIPSKINEVITRRTTRLGRQERRLLELAAVSGHSFDPVILSRTLSSDMADVLQGLVEIEKRHRLVRSEDSTFEFTHHKIREVIYRNMPSELRRVYHLKTADCLEQALTEKKPGDYLTNIAHHYVEGGAPEKAFRYLVELGEKSVNAYASGQAVEYLNKALETAQKTPGLATDENLAKIHKHRGRAWLQQDEKAKARNDFNSMLQKATAISDKSMIAESHHLLGVSYEAYFGEMDEAMLHLSTAVEMARKIGDKRLEAKSSGAIGITLMWGTGPDKMDEGRVRLEESFRLAKEIGDKITEASILGNLGFYYNWKGEFDRAKENLNKKLALCEEVGIVGDLFPLCMVLGGNGEYNEAISVGQRCLRLARDSGDWSAVSMVLNTLGWIYHDLSNVELAIRYNNEAIENARAHGKSRASGAVPVSLFNLGMDYLYKNDHEKTEEYFNEVVNQYQQHRLGWWRIETRLLVGRGELALAKGDYAQALKLVEDSLVISKKADAKKYIAKGLRLKAEILAKMDNTQEAIELMQSALKLAQELGNPPLLWQTHYSLGALLEKYENQQKANEHYAEAVALIEETASKLNDASLKNTLLTAPLTKAIHDAYTKTKSTL